MIYGKIFYRGEFVEAGIEVEEGRIKRIGKLLKGKKLRGIILPAGIDVHVHFRDFEEKRKETIETGSLSALHGGICLVVDQPNTKPVVENEEIYFRRMEKAEKSSYVDYTLNLALTRKNSNKIDEIVEKIREKYFLPAIGEVFLQNNDKELEISYEMLKNLKVNAKLTIHAEDPRFVEIGNPNFLFRKREAEILAVEECEKLGDFHFCHLSTREAVEKVKRGTFEVAPHHILLNIDDYAKLGDFVNVNPPLRQKSDAEWLLKNFSRIQILASDHAPHTIEDKKMGSAGFPGVETTFPIFVELAKRGLISFNDLVEKIAVNPAKIFGFRDYGEIEVGKFANFAVFDLNNVQEIKSEKLHSLCNWTPYEGFKAIFPKWVYLRGEEVLENQVRSGKLFKVSEM
ncbi:MAG: dihydroorotase [Archaeoglobaceae archaeon]|nr:dihydroorotase [Archaeoglobaceae archaeon]MDW8128069.1 dihydroorotase [Archaeoglobaceae archaeon]